LTARDHFIVLEGRRVGSPIKNLENVFEFSLDIFNWREKYKMRASFFETYLFQGKKMSKPLVLLLSMIEMILRKSYIFVTY